MMDLKIVPGKYVVAVSGGVDSMVLLDILSQQAGLELTVAHYDHGIRADSATDRQLVQQAAAVAGLAFMTERGELGPHPSEAIARVARYAFLERAKEMAGAKAIITAHHQDDVLETMVINLLRGTGRRGLSSLTSHEQLVRPLLAVPKSELRAYARKRQLQWREDSTNADMRYLRNRIRHQLLPRWSAEQKQRLLAINDRMQVLNQEIDEALEPIASQALPRDWFQQLPHDLALEVMATWLRRRQITDYDQYSLQRLVVAAKVNQAGSSVDVSRHTCLLIGKDRLLLTTIERAASLAEPELALQTLER